MYSLIKKSLLIFLILSFFSNISQAETYECQASDPEGSYLN